MKAFVYVLALIFFTITNAQETAWTGGGGSVNQTASSVENWSNGLPDENSIVYINNTNCGGSCTVKFAENLVIAELHVNSTSSTISIDIEGANVTVLKVFVWGNPWYSSAALYIRLTAGAIFEIGEEGVATIYPSYYDQIIYANDDTESWFVNKGYITFIGTEDTTSTYETIQFGSSTDYTLQVWSSGTWDVTDSKVLLSIYEVGVVSVWGGQWLGSWIDADDVSIQFYDTSVVLQEGAGDDSEGSPFQWVYFRSYYTQGVSDYTTGNPPSTLIFNTTDLKVENAQFYGTNIIFLYSGILSSVNISSYTLVNTTSLGVQASFEGDNWITGYVIFTAINANDFVVQIEAEANLYFDSYIYLFGPITLLNNGTITVSSGTSYIYQDPTSYVVNLGLIDLQSYLYFYGISFPGLSDVTDVGTTVNMGTIQFTDSGSLYFSAQTGEFRQCKHGIVKYDFENTPGYTTLPTVELSGYVGALFPKDATIAYYETLFTWKTPADGSFPFGDIEFIVKGKLPLVDVIFCVSKTDSTGTAKIYDVDDLTSKLPLCPDGEYQKLIPFVSGDACSDLPDNIKQYEDVVASCPAGNNCGVDTGAPAGEPGTEGSANVNAASLAFLVSLVCLLFKF